jgi:hypothetical protein
MRDARYIEIPGDRTHELPPLLVRGAGETRAEEDVLGMASMVVESEDLLAEIDAAPDVMEQRKFDLALQLTEQYRGLLAHWQWGDSILEWVRQCEITFDCDATLRRLLHPDVWPHASRSSFVTLLQDKHIPTPVGVQKAVGLRLTFRQPPPIDCFSDQFLFYLNSTVADSAYQTWSHLSLTAASLLPPDRFHFEVVNIGN